MCFFYIKKHNTIPIITISMGAVIVYLYGEHYGNVVTFQRSKIIFKENLHDLPSAVIFL